MLSQTGPLVLIVEDNRDDELLTLRAFQGEKLGIRIIVARDGEQAMDYLRAKRAIDGLTIDSPPDLILLDLKLPKHSGLEVLKELRKCDKTRCTPVILFSSGGEESDISACYRAGANTYIQKPVDFAEYTRTINAITNYWIKTARLPSIPKGWASSAPHAQSESPAT